MKSSRKRLKVHPFYVVPAYLYLVITTHQRFLRTLFLFLFICILPKNIYADFDLRGFNHTLSKLSGNDTITTNQDPPVESLATLTFGDDTERAIFSGNLVDGNQKLGITKVGAGEQVLSGISQHSGPTIFRQGQITLRSPTALSPHSDLTLEESILNLSGFSSTVGSLSGGRISRVWNSGLVFDTPEESSRIISKNQPRVPATLTIGNTNANGDFSGAIGQGNAAISIIKVGTGEQIFSGDKNTYAYLNIKEGIVSQGIKNAFSPNAAVEMENNSILDLRGYDGTIYSLKGAHTEGTKITNTGDQDATLTVGPQENLLPENSSYSGAIVDGEKAKVRVRKIGKNTTLTLSGTENTYSGTTTISGGTLEQGIKNAFSKDSDVFVESNAILSTGGFDGNIGGLSGEKNSVVTNNGAQSATLTVGKNNSNGSFKGHLKDGIDAAGRPVALTFEKTGQGEQSLTGTSSHTGGNRISEGTLIGTTSSLQGNIDNDAALVFKQTFTDDFEGTISGEGSVTIDSAKQRINYAQAQNYTGKTKINAGTLGQKIEHALSGGSDLSIEKNATLDLSGYNAKTGSLNGEAGAVVTNSGKTNATLSIGNTNTEGKYAGIIEDGPNGKTALNKEGTHAQILSGRNTYSGTTTIKRGILKQGDAYAFSKKSAVNIEGSGQLDLSGYSGHIKSLNSLSTSSVVTNNSKQGTTLTLGDENTSIFAGTIKDGVNISDPKNTKIASLEIIKIGSGTQILSGKNTYRGNTTIKEGILKQGTPNAASPYSDLKIQGGTYDLGGYDSTVQILEGTEAAIITNNGENPSTLTFGGDQNRVFAIDGKPKSFAGKIIDGTKADGKTVATLGITKIGTTTQVLSGKENTYTGETTIKDGTLKQGALNAVSPYSDLKIVKGTYDLGGYDSTIKSLDGTKQASITNNGESAANLTFGDDKDKIFAGTIRDGMKANRETAVLGLTKIGSGKQTLIGNNTYTGPTIIKSGELVVNGELKSEKISIESKGTLSGVGTIARSLENSGTFKPGNSVGTFNIHENYTQTSEGSLIIEIASSTEYDRIIVGGTAQLEGNLYVEFLGTFLNDYPEKGSVFTILTAGQGIDPNHRNWKLNSPFDLLEISYLDNEAQLIVPSAPELIERSVMREDLQAASFVTSLFGSNIEELIPTLNINIKDILFNVTNTQYGQVTSRLGAIRAGVGGLSFNGLSDEPMEEAFSKRESSIIDSQGTLLAYVQAEPSRWNIFANASGIFSTINNTKDLPKIDAITGLFTVGADCRINENLNVGVYTGYQSNKAWYTDGSWLRNNGVKCGLYGTVQYDGFYLDALLGAGAHFFQLNRSIDIGKHHWTARSSPSGIELDSLLGGGYEFNLGPWRFGANTSFQYTYLDISSLNESGAGNLNAKVESQNPNSLVYTLGTNISYLWEIHPNFQIFPTAGLSWQHEFLNNGQKIAGRFANGKGAPFIFSTPPGARNNGFASLGITVQIRRRFGFYAYYNPQFGGNIFSHGFLLGANYSF